MTKEWAARLPKSIRVGPFEFRLEPWGHLPARSAGRYGEFSLMEQAIRIQEEHASIAALVDTVFHELTHAIWRVRGMEDSDNEERVAATFGTAWTEIYRDNPALVDWLAEASKAMRVIEP